jgi:hypothetical protein
MSQHVFLSRVALKVETTLTADDRFYLDEHWLTANLILCMSIERRGGILPQLLSV